MILVRIVSVAYDDVAGVGDILCCKPSEHSVEDIAWHLACLNTCLCAALPVGPTVTVKIGPKYHQKPTQDEVVDVTTVPRQQFNISISC